MSLLQFVALASGDDLGWIDRFFIELFLQNLSILADEKIYAARGFVFVHINTILTGHFPAPVTYQGELYSNLVSEGFYGNYGGWGGNYGGWGNYGYGNYGGYGWSSPGYWNSSPYYGGSYGGTYVTPGFGSVSLVNRAPQAALELIERVPDGTWPQLAGYRVAALSLLARDEDVARSGPAVRCRALE